MPYVLSVLQERLFCKLNILKIGLQNRRFLYGISKHTCFWLILLHILGWTLSSPVSILPLSNPLHLFSLKASFLLSRVSFQLPGLYTYSFPINT